MEGKRAVLLLAVSVFIACGGAQPSTTGSSAPNAAITTAPTAAASAKPSAATSIAADAGPQLAALLAASKNATHRTTYKITASGGGADGFNGEQTWYFKPPRARFDFAATQDGKKTTISYLSLPEGQFYCITIGQAQCFAVTGVGSPLDENTAVVAQQVLISDPGGFGATASAARTLAGQSAQCFDVNSKSGGTAFDTGTFCYSGGGVPLLSTFSTAQYASWTTEATASSGTVAEADFTLPAKPIGR
ncbi:MAG TPA: hypothetical protein VEU77_04640 [Candidatus Acidoferrales bacterium]|nr:hypothetical protein [Candidatus Acidoferrales bacterium]